MLTCMYCFTAISKSKQASYCSKFYTGLKLKPKPEARFWLYMANATLFLYSFTSLLATHDVGAGEGQKCLSELQ